MSEEIEKTLPPPDLDPYLKFRMGLALMNEENRRLYLHYLQMKGKTQLREEALKIIDNWKIEREKNN
jgi:hypothetical protein